MTNPKKRDKNPAYLEKLVEDWVESVLLDFCLPLAALALVRQQIHFDISVTRSFYVIAPIQGNWKTVQHNQCAAAICVVQFPVYFNKKFVPHGEGGDWKHFERLRG